MIDLVLFMGRIALVVVLYLFLFVVMKTGIGLVRGQRKDPAIWCVDVDKGPRQHSYSKTFTPQTARL